jgi:hypothetical protein
MMSNSDQRLAHEMSLERTHMPCRTYLHNTTSCPSIKINSISFMDKTGVERFRLLDVLLVVLKIA